MRLLVIIFIIFSFIDVKSQEIPFLAAENFEFKLDYNFKTKPPPERDKVNLVENHNNHSASLLPYVKVNFSFSDLANEAFRVRVIKGAGTTVMSKKLKKLDLLSFDMGFSDDIKDRVKPHTYLIYVENKEKERLSRIKIFVEESGDFYLNDQLYGKI